MRIIQLLFFYLFLTSVCFSQTATIDSLLAILKTDKADTNKLKHLNQLSKQYTNEGYYNEAITQITAALKLNKKLQQENKNLKAKTVLKKHEAESYNNNGMLFFAQGNYPESLKNHLSSLKINEENNDSKAMAASYNSIGTIYDYQGNYEEALKNYKESLKISEAINDKTGIANSTGNIGIIFDNLGNYEEALKNYNTSLQILITLKDDFGIAAGYNNIGLIQFAQKNYTEALKNYQEALLIFEKLQNIDAIIAINCNIVDVYLKQKNSFKAKDILILTKLLAEKKGSKQNLKVVYFRLFELESVLKNHSEALNYHILFVKYKDSLDNEEMRKQTIQNQMTYDFEKKQAVANVEHKKELEIHKNIAEQKNKKQQVIIISVILGLLFVVVIASYIWKTLSTTRKQKNIIELQKTEVEHQKSIVEEKQKEIIDSITYAKRLQKAILPSDEEIKKHLPTSFVLYKPKDIVAGDFYWLHTVEKDGVTLVAAADSTGHGVPGAMVSVVCSNALNRAVNEFNIIEPGKLLDKTREIVLETFTKSGEEIKDGMDISLLSINRKTKEISWSGANNQLWFFQNNVFCEIKADKQSIGKTDNSKPFTTHTIQWNTGDTYYLITDGYVDQFGGEKKKKYKHKKLQENLCEINKLPLSEQKEILDKNFEEWRGNLEQVDDVTIIGIKV
ncbi:MAG: tetratricopeptide repeat protein [Bacteroidota bacterium]